MCKIDAHIHYVDVHPDLFETLDSLELKLLNVCVADDLEGNWRDWANKFRALSKKHPDMFFWCTTFDLPDFSKDYTDRVIAGLEQDFADGALACKFWKNIGMALRKPSGEFLLIDDPLFDPIYEYLVKVDKPALMHIGEPLGAWQPLNKCNLRCDYYSKHPDWHMFQRDEFPSHQELMEARDHVLAKHPKLRVIGAHLGSLEYNVAALAKCFDAYPNFAVDTSSRTCDLALQESNSVHNFFLEYSDRILFGTDMIQDDLNQNVSSKEFISRLNGFESRYDNEFSYYETDTAMSVRETETLGLGLPANVLDNFYFKNAQQWYQGL